MQRQQAAQVPPRRRTVPAPTATSKSLVYPAPSNNQGPPRRLSSSFGGGGPTFFSTGPSMITSRIGCGGRACSISQSLAAAQQMMGHQPPPQAVGSPRSVAGGSAAADAPTTGPQDPFLSGATIVTNAVSNSSAETTITVASSAPSLGRTASVTPNMPPEVVLVNGRHKGTRGGAGVAASSSTKDEPNGKGFNRRHTMPASIILRNPNMSLIRPANPPPPTHPVPEFLCHLYSMLSDPQLNELITWVVPLADETTHAGGGRKGVGKIVVHDPTRLQNEVLGNYYRHSKYSSFQRQLNYFGFKKRLHGSKKGKMCPCSFVHDNLGTDPQSLLNLKRRPPSNKRNELMAQQAMEAYNNGSPGSKKRGHPVTKDGRTGMRSPTHYVASSAISVASSASCSSGVSNAPAPPPSMAQAWVGAPGQAPPPSGPLQARYLGSDMRSMTSSATSVTTSSAPSPSAAPNGNNQNKDYMAMVRDANNATVLEAKKSLAANFLKSQRESLLQRGLGSAGVAEPSPRPSPPVQARPSPPVQMRPSPPRENVVALQQQPRQQPHLQQRQVLHQPVQSMVPNRFPSTHPFGADNNGVVARLVAEQQPQSMTGTALMGTISKPTFPAPSPFVKVDPGNALPQQAPSSFFGGFPTKTPQLLGSDHAAAVSDMMSNSSPPTNYLMSPTHSSTGNPMPPTLSALPPTYSNPAVSNAPSGFGAETHPQGMDDSPPIDNFNELLSNLLSTALPPSEDLFDDDLSAGNISDVLDEAVSASMMDGMGGGHLQVADDGGMLMPP